MQREPGALRDGACAPMRCRCSKRCASASAARSRSSAWRPTTSSWCSTTRRRSTTAPIDMPMDVLLGKPPRMHRDVRRVAWQGRPLDLTGVALDDGGVRRAAPPDGGEQALPDHDRRPHGRRPEPPRPDGRPVAGAGGRLRGDAGRLQRLSRRGDEPRRAHAAGRARRAGLGPDGGGRGADQPARRAGRAVAREAELQLDGRLRRARRRCGAVRHRARGRHGAVPGARHQRAGRQGQPVDAHAMERRRRGEAGDGAGVADRHRLRDAGRRARHADAAAAARRHHADPDRPRARPQPHGRLDPRADAGAERRQRPRPRRCRSAAATVRCREPAARRGPVARLPRPQRRRAVGGGVRDGIRRALRREPERRPAGDRGRWHRRQPGRLRRIEELGDAGRRAAQRADAARAVQRGTRRRDPGPDRGS